MTGAVILLIHFGLMAVLFLRWRSGVLKTGGAAVFAALFLPIFGELSLLVIHLERKSGKMGAHSDDLEAMAAEGTKESIYHRRTGQHVNTALPLEDVLIINDDETRRAALLDILLDDSDVYLPQIRQAQHNDDPEVVHYATSALTQKLEKANARLHTAEQKFSESGASDAALDEYIDVLAHYIDSRMAEGELLENYRAQYQKLLQMRIDRRHAQDDYAALAESYLDSGRNEAADQIISVLEQRWRKSARTLELRLRYEYTQNQGEQLQETLDEARRDGSYSPQVKRSMNFWE